MADFPQVQPNHIRRAANDRARDALESLITEQYIEVAQDRYEHQLDALEKCCQSPIEQILAAHMTRLIYGGDPNQCMIWPQSYLDYDKCLKMFEYAIYDYDGVDPICRIFPQVRLPGRIVDFLVMSGEIDLEQNPHRLNPNTFGRIIVECDGHEFHERTKDQAQRDRSFDRNAQRLGITIFRFTGREIYRDPKRCVNEINRFLTKILYPKSDGYDAFEEGDL